MDMDINNSDNSGHDNIKNTESADEYPVTH
jgi:hypothetical protein